MAIIPISVRDIVTPYSLMEEQSVSLTETTNGKQTIVRTGGARWSLNVGIRPFNMLQDGDKYMLVSSFLSATPSFEFPIQNVVKNNVSGTATVSANAAVGDNKVTVTGHLGSFKAGQYIRFSNKNKFYQILSVSGDELTLTTRLRQKLTSGIDTVIYQELGYNFEYFDGILGRFNNQDFGQSPGGVSGGIIAEVGPLVLIEDL